MIMMNVLDLRTYDSANKEIRSKHDVNLIPAVERYEMAYARGRCWDILQWFFSVYEILDKIGNPIDGFKSVALFYLSQQASVIIEFKKRALKSGLDDNSHFTLKSLEKQMKNCFLNYSDVPEIRPPALDRDLTLSFPNPQRYGVRKLAVAKPYECK